MASILERVKKGWNAFQTSEEVSISNPWATGASYGTRPDRQRVNTTNERSILASVFTRVGIDVASVSMEHVRLDENKRFIESIPSGLNSCLTLEANIDQGARAFRQDMAMTLLEKGVIAVVAVDTTFNPRHTSGFDILSLRVGEIINWYPSHVRVKLYNCGGR